MDRQTKLLLAMLIAAIAAYLAPSLLECVSSKACRFPYCGPHGMTCGRSMEPAGND